PAHARPVAAAGRAARRQLTPSLDDGPGRARYGPPARAWGIGCRVLPHERALMHFEHTEKVKALLGRLAAFFAEHIHPHEAAVSELVAGREGKARWEPIPHIEQLKPKARGA